MRIDTVAFEFKAGAAFLDYPHHPITVPQDVDPRALGLEMDSITAVLPHGERLDAKIHHGPNNTTVYNQLQFKGAGVGFPGYLKLGDRLVVLLFKSGGRSYAVLEYR